MTLENKHRADNKTLREFYEETGSKGVLWIDHRECVEWVRLLERLSEGSRG